MKNQAFTLIEILVVVLIIGILAAIAVPQYQKAVLKSRLSTGLPLLRAVYDAQQMYKLRTGEYCGDIDKLDDITIPKNSSCQKLQSNNNYSRYCCDFGCIGIYDSLSNVQFSVRNTLAYLKIIKDVNIYGMDAKENEEWCFANVDMEAAKGLCESFGGQKMSEDTSGSPKWARYKIVK